MSYILPSTAAYAPDPNPSPVQEPSSPTSDEQQILGQVERVAFHQKTSGFCVLKVKISGSRDFVTVTGSVGSILPSDCIQATGRWEDHNVYGMQFIATSLTVMPPTAAEGMECYLASGLINEIGPELAKRLVDAFGERVFEVIEQTPQRLTEIKGIGAIRVEQIISKWADQKDIREIILFLHAHRANSVLAIRIFQTYGNNAIRIISENPYRLARDIQGITFSNADRIAEKLGIENTALVRLRAGVFFTLMNETRIGHHCCLPESDVLSEAGGLLGIHPVLLEEALEHELVDRMLVGDYIDGRRCIFPPLLWQAEQVIADRLSTLRRGRLPWEGIDIGNAIPWAEAKLGVELAGGQRDAIRVAVTSKLMVITGGPGVGKTTIINSIIHILAARSVTVALAAPTGRAAKRLSETTGLEANTIHRLLEIDPINRRFNRGEDWPIECDLLIVDEMSMVDVPLMASLLKAVPNGAAVILVGDVDQLPSVGPGQVLADIIASGMVPVARLTEVYRQAATSRIIINARRINRGEMPDLSVPGDGGSDFFFFEENSAKDAAAKIIAAVSEGIPKRFGLDPIRDIQVLCPMKRRAIGTQSLNRELQAVLNPADRDQPEVIWSNNTYRAGDKVMQIVNNYEKGAFNGDIGFITAIDTVTSELTIDFGGRTVVYMLGELDNLVLAYATTIHKSQGSEYPAVVIPVMTSHRIMLTRRLIYTAVTRGKKLVVLVGQKEAIAMAMASGLDRHRWSKLRERLIAARK